jgi:CubicO group peptidase (beta-lactamase class C family)
MRGIYRFITTVLFLALVFVLAKYDAAGSNFKVQEISKILSHPQRDISFPQDINSTDFDRGILPAAFVQFLGYQDQGYILIIPQNIDSFDIFVNDFKIDSSVFKKNKINKIDISSFTKNGENVIQVTNIIGGGSIRVQIPYPEVIEDLISYKDNKTFKLIDDIIEAEIRNGFTSAQLVVIKNGKIIKQTSYGYINNYTQDGNPIDIEKRVKVTNETLFDLASNTKMYACNYAIQKLVSDGAVKLSDLVSKYIPDFKDGDNDIIKGKNILTIKDILMHQAGFPADVQYHNDKYTGNGVGKDGKNILFSQNRKKTEEMIVKTPLIYAPGTKTIYSDVDYMILGLIVEKVSGKRLDKYAEENFYNPLGLKRITFTPLKKGFKKKEIAATELRGNTRDGAVSFANIRTKTIQGEVHDEKAFYSMGGISGHAGLFANAKDLAKLAQVMINGGGYGDKRFFDAQTVETFTKPKDIDDTYGLGWRRQGANFGYSWAFSPLADKSAIGHTGWTGTLTVIDPRNNIIIVLLTSTKNSPVLNKSQDANTMLANKYFTGAYGLITTLVFGAFINDSDQANESRIAEIVLQKNKQITQSPAKWDNLPSRQSLQAVIEVLAEYKSDI